MPSLETRLKAIFTMARNGQTPPETENKLCLTLTFAKAHTAAALYNNILLFLSQHGEATEGGLQFESGSVDIENNTANIRMSLPALNGQADIKTATEAYLELLKNRRFQSNSALAGITYATTPCQTRYKFKGYQRDYASI